METYFRKETVKEIVANELENLKDQFAENELEFDLDEFIDFMFGDDEVYIIYDGDDIWNAIIEELDSYAESSVVKPL